MPNEYPSKDPKICNSRAWWDLIEQAADRFEANLNQSYSGFFQLVAEKLKSALDMYEGGWWTFKEYVYREKAKEKHIDRHKIIALYILSLLAKEPFRPCNSQQLESSEEEQRLFFLANEVFSLEIMQIMINGWNKANNKVYNMSENEKEWLVILFNRLKLKMRKADIQNISDKTDPDSVEIISTFLALAQIVYYLEKTYCMQQ